MFRNIGFGAAALLAAGALAMGCSDEGDTVLGGSVLLPDNFPGSQVFENNVADDGRAFSNQGQDVLHSDSSLRPSESQIYWNKADGTAIGLYTTEVNQTGVYANTTNVIQKHLYAVRFNGTSWSAPVAIRGFDAADQDDQESDITDFAVCFINTAGQTDVNVTQRNGDAVIVFIRQDLTPTLGNGQTTEENANGRAWMTYFDASAATSPASGSVVGGFDTQALAIDTDNVFTANADPSVTMIGFVSDSLVGSHEFRARTSTVQSPTAVDSGDPTSFLSIIFAKANSSGATGVGTRLFEVVIDGTAVGNVLTDLAGTATIVDSTAGFANGDEVSSTVTVHNEYMFWTYTESTSGENDQIGTVSEFDDTGAFDEVLYGATLNSDTNEIIGLPDAADVFGTDHGDLASIYFFFTESGVRADGTLNDAETSPDTDLIAGKIDTDAALAVERAKIDSFDDVANVTTNPVRGTQTNTSTNVQDFGTRMNRTGEYITVLYTQSNTDLDTVSSPAGEVPEDNVLLYATVVQTRLVDPSGTTAARDLADSVSDDDAALANFQGVQVPSQVSSGTTATASDDRQDVDDVDFQLDLVTGQAESQQDSDEANHLSIDTDCAIQSDAGRMNFVYTQFDDPSTTNADINILYVNGILVTLDVDVTVAPVVELVDTSATIVDTQDSDWDSGEFNATAVDAGDVTRDALGNPDADSGRVLVFYALDSANTPDDDTTAGGFFERRAFVWDAGDNELLSTDGNGNHDQLDSFLDIVTVPGSGTGTHFAGDTIHVIWSESVDRTSALRMVTRSYKKSLINDLDTANDALTDRFTPNLVGGTAEDGPVQIDNPTNGALMSTTITQTFGSGFGDDFFAARNGSEVGVYFTEDEHVYYTDTSTDALGWDSTNNVAAPQLVDNDSLNGARVLAVQIFVKPVCDNLAKSMAFFLRDDISQSFGLAGGRLAPAVRSYVRIHN